MADHFEKTVELPDVNDTDALGRAIAPLLTVGDVVTFSGDLGAGKTTLARAIIRMRAGDDALSVPSPTFTLVQDYDLPTGHVFHADFYRLEEPDAALELGLADAVADSVTLIEWPENGVVPDGAMISIHLGTSISSGRRTAKIRAGGEARDRLSRAWALMEFLKAAGWSDAARVMIQGDASTRRYERLSTSDGRSAILMDAPRRPDGPPVKDGLPYSKLAHLAEDVVAFVAVCEWLREQGLSAPEILAADLDAGFVLCHDLGTVGVRDEGTGAPIPDRYGLAVDVLARLHGVTPPQSLTTNGQNHPIHAYDASVCAIEISLFADWFVPFVIGSPLAPDVRGAFFDAWSEDLCPALSEDVLVLRDFHSPNLIWREDRAGLDRMGLVDVQDALRGHPAYDLASLAQDARVRVPFDLEEQLIDHYSRLRSEDVGFDQDAFRSAYPVHAAQRITKVMGIFVRLNVRDQKPGYMAHLPHLIDALERNLSSPHLSRVAAWHTKHCSIASMRAAVNTTKVAV
ncbi:MAG: tRNA (adenosine(37)-N6)-threonylcarbamoyltransferase complex ATPase subunit type 1 TsaE [Pseudomonadota bacterium]